MSLFRWLFILLTTVRLQASSFEAMREKYEIQSVHYFAYYNNLQALQEMISVDKNMINVTDKFGNTPLHYAAYYNRRSVTNLLLAHGADVNLPNKLGDTPLFFAAVKSNQEIMIILCEHNANIRHRNKLNHTPLAVADKTGKQILNSVDFLHTLSKK